MQISFPCPGCNATLEADAEQGGANLTCPACNEELRVPIPRIEPGTTLGNFRIEKKLGSGGMGDVFLANQISMDRRVALKVLGQAMTRDKAVVERFLHEVRMSARLEHPHIVTAFEAGEDHGYYYLAMSYVDGEDLGTRLREKGALPEENVLRYGIQVAEALGYVWENFQMLHRDIKPANIIVDHSDNAKLMDMGISKSITEHDAALTAAGMVVGTPYYMSPEQARSGTELDFRADMYSLGASLYHLVTGTVPYDGDGTIAILTKHVMDPFPRPRERNAHVSRAFGHLLHVMMAKRPQDRYQSWRLLIQDMGQVAKGMQPKQPRPREPVPTGAAPATPSASPLPKKPPAAPATPAKPQSDAPAEEKLPPVVKSERMMRRVLRRQRRKRMGIAALVVLIPVVLGLAALEIRNLRSRKPDPLTSAPNLSIRVPAPASPEPILGTEGLEVDEFRAVESPLEEVFDRAVADLAEGNLDQSRAGLARAREDPELKEFAADLATFSTALRNLRNINRYVEESFRKDVGKTVTVSLQSGTESLQIRSIAPGGRILARKQTGRGATQKTEKIEFSISDLAPAERLERLEAFSRRPEVALALGLLYVKQEDFAKAEDSLLKLPGSMQGAFLRKLRKLRAEHEKSSRTSGRTERVSP